MHLKENVIAGSTMSFKIHRLGQRECFVCIQFIRFFQYGPFPLGVVQEGWREPGRKLDNVHSMISDVFLEASKNTTKRNVPHC